jgi:hypothetical protein
MNGLMQLAAIVPIGAIPGAPFSTLGQVMDMLALHASVVDLIRGLISDFKKLGAGQAIIRGLKNLILTGLSFGAGTLGNYIDDILEAAAAEGGTVGVIIGTATGVGVSVGLSGVQALAYEAQNAESYSKEYTPTGNPFLDFIGQYMPATANRLKENCVDMFKPKTQSGG